MVDLEKLDSEVKEPPASQTPIPTPRPYEIPMPPGDLQDPDVIKQIRENLKNWPWKKILEQYDLDGDGKLSPDEIKKFLQDRCEERFDCRNFIKPKTRDRAIDFILCKLLDRGALCNIQDVELTPELIIDWLSRWIKYIEFNVQQCADNSKPTDAERRECDKWKKILEELKKLRDLFRKLNPEPESQPQGSAEVAW